MMSRAEIWRRYYAKHRDEIRAKSRADYAADPHKRDEEKAAYYAAHREELRAKNRIYEKTEARRLKKQASEQTEKIKARLIGKPTHVATIIKNMKRLIVSSGSACMLRNKPAILNIACGGRFVRV